ncbi:MAG: DnaJ domain-containing protein [Cetobacterium sp.]|uniref:J domain-containing protein n=1 Tax=unclassified Cetobacterium TaxID=2630983 RepID=UPI00163B7F62|nr:DnaJ domain-containing protein [Cetobacterium sp. 2A]MBC2856010.1 DnaJ domain-containing protein [Cetobacterium sp. 2A]
MIEIAIGITFVIFFLIAIIFGMNKAISALPVLFFMALLLSFFGFFVIKFFPILLIIGLISYFRRKKNPPQGKSYYYKTYKTEDFEEFFKQAGGQHYTGGNGYSNQGNPFGGHFEDKSKYYSVLGVEKGSSKDEIKKAYRDLAKKHHPDKYVNETQELRDYHEKKFKEINEAYEKLNKE